jgi:UDP-glucose 4-epimerase
MQLKDKVIMVTGGAGFIGSHIVDALVHEKPKKLIVVDNLFLGKDSNLKNAMKKYSDLPLCKVDLAAEVNTPHHDTIELMMAVLHGVDVVFNCAVVPLLCSLTEPKFCADSNWKIVSNLCELQRKELFKTLIHVSSSEAYGSAEYAPMDEDHPLAPSTPYAASKGAGDLLALSYAKTFGLDTAIMRPFNTYGPRQNARSYAGIIPLTVKRILSKKKPIINGDGKQTRDYTYVDDVADAAISIYKCKKTRGRVVNIASGEEVSVKQMITLISSLMEYKGEVLHGPERPGDVRRHIANIYLARDLFGYKPTVKLEDGMKKTVEWYLANRSCLN